MLSDGFPSGWEAHSRRSGFDCRGPSLLSTLAGGVLLYRAASGNCPLYQALGVSTSDSTNPNTAIAAGHGTRVEHAVTVNKPAAEVYRFWRDFENLPRFMTHLIDVDTTTDGRSHWVAKGPLGLKVEWDAEIVADTPAEVIGWKSLDGSDVDTAGSVRFRELPHGRGTEVRVNLKYDPPAGKLGRAIAKLFGEAPEHRSAKTCAASSRSWKPARFPRLKGNPVGNSSVERERPAPASPASRV